MLAKNKNLILFKPNIIIGHRKFPSDISFFVTCTPSSCALCSGSFVCQALAKAFLGCRPAQWPPSSLIRLFLGLEEDPGRHHTHISGFCCSMCLCPPVACLCWRDVGQDTWSFLLHLQEGPGARLPVTGKPSWALVWGHFQMFCCRASFTCALGESSVDECRTLC